MASTAQIIAERALQEPCGENCVDWAIGLLESGHDTITICRLAAQRPPYDHFELVPLRDQILTELGLINTSMDESILMYATELLAKADAGTMPLDTAIAEVKDLCIGNDYQDEIYDFYLLYFANADLREQDSQYYYPDANRSNIEQITRDRVSEFVRAQRNRGITNE